MCISKTGIGIGFGVFFFLFFSPQENSIEVRDAAREYGEREVEEQLP